MEIIPVFAQKMLDDISNYHGYEAFLRNPAFWRFVNGVVTNTSLMFPYKSGNSMQNLQRPLSDTSICLTMIISLTKIICLTMIFEKLKFFLTNYFILLRSTYSDSYDNWKRSCGQSSLSFTPSSSIAPISNTDVPSDKHPGLYNSEHSHFGG